MNALTENVSMENCHKALIIKYFLSSERDLTKQNHDKFKIKEKKMEMRTLSKIKTWKKTNNSPRESLFLCDEKFVTSFHSYAFISDAFNSE